MPEPPVLCTVSEGLATVTLNRPAALNALNTALVRDLDRVLRSLAVAPEVRAILLTGAGKAFCAGGDIKEAEHLPAAAAREFVLGAGRVCELIATLDKPVIAAVGGVAFGGGLHLATACDVLVAAQSARFAAVFVKLGLAPDMAGAYTLPRLIGWARARHLFLTGEAIDAATARAWGLVSAVVPDDELMARAEQVGRQWAAGPTQAYGAIKRLLRFSATATFADLVERDAETQALLLQTRDCREGLAAHAERRPPRFGGH